MSGAAARNAQNQYQREWRKNHREKVKEYTERYWTKKAKQIEAEKKEIETAIGE